MRKKWSAEETDELVRRYGSLPNRVLQRKYFPHRTQKSVETKAAKLGLLRGNPSDRWTDAERDLLAAHMDMTSGQLKRRFFPDKTYDAVASMKTKVKSGTKPVPGNPSRGKPKPWTDAELGLLDRYYGTMPATELRKKYLPGRTVRSITQTAHMRGGLRPARVPWTPDEERTLEENYGRMPTSEIQRTLMPHRSRRTIENKITRMGIRRKHSRT